MDQTYGHLTEVEAFKVYCYCKGMKQWEQEKESYNNS